MPLRTSISGTIISIIIGILITLGVSQNSIDFYGVPLIAVCFLYAFANFWCFRVCVCVCVGWYFGLPWLRVRLVIVTCKSRCF